jgi:hypothetical protein
MGDILAADLRAAEAVTDVLDVLNAQEVASYAGLFSSAHAARYDKG